MDMKIVGENIRQHRKIKGLTQEELAKAASLSTMSIRRYESGERIAPQKALIAIAKALGVHLRDLADTSMWNEFDKKYPNMGEEVAEFEDFKTFLESVGYIVKFVPAGEEGDSFTAELIKGDKKTEFSKAEFENFKLETKKSVDYQVWKQSQESK